MNIYDLLNRISVMECDEMNVALSSVYDHENPNDRGGAHHPHPAGWFAVCDDDGIFAYFMRHKDALRYRLDHVNRILNT